MEVKVIALTSEVDSGIKADDSSFRTFGGKMAGICYMKNGYFNCEIQNEASANRKADITLASGHHSVFGHSHLTFEISGIPKILAMLLNSVEEYNTSEKSARYTVMEPETALEREVYNKWFIRFKALFLSREPNIAEKHAEKLAMENARYMTSVFTPTYMAWTTSYRQVAYVTDWLEDLANNCSKLEGDFNIKLSSGCLELASRLKECTTANENIHDNKSRSLEFMLYQADGLRAYAPEIIGDVYQVSYLSSLAALAQLQRHRTIHYEMYFDGKTAKQFGCYIPPALDSEELIHDWLEDFDKLAYCFPQCTLVQVVEQGRAVKFFDKAKERMCGRAQLEVMHNTLNTLRKFITNKGSLSDKTAKHLDEITGFNNKPVAKCCMPCMKCTEPCYWGGERGTNRTI